MKKTIFFMIALCFIISCKKAEVVQENEPMDWYIAGIQYIIIDKDSNTLFKYPNILNSKYNPKNTFITDEKGNRFGGNCSNCGRISTYILDSSGNTGDYIENIDSLKNDDAFYCYFTTNKIKYESTWFNDINISSSTSYKYYIKYNDNTTDTIDLFPYLNLYGHVSSDGFYLNGKPLPAPYTGSKYPHFKNKVLIIK